MINFVTNLSFALLKPDLKKREVSAAASADASVAITSCRNLLLPWQMDQIPRAQLKKKPVGAFFGILYIYKDIILYYI